MKWKKPDHKTGDTRTRKGFLFFPKYMDRETRWLEYAEWSQFFQEAHWMESSGGYWVNSGWLN